MTNNKGLKSWLNDFKPDCPLIIAGPCSAETEEQVLKTAHEIKDSDVSVLRAGIWKPRTRPGGFEGVGAIGLKWLQKAKQETGLLVATEVATRAHVELVLEHDIDILWIGARTTVNPFAVQEIAEALENTDKIVLLKNPVNPDLSLWIGGLERLYNANIKKLGVIHRGFSTYEKNNYRNNPEWQIAIEMQSKFPDLPMICDPSHITGNRNMIQQVSQQALDLNYDGLMIETHINPDKAWSDPAQQVTPDLLKKILNNLKVRKQTDEDFDFISAIAKLRTQINETDEKILEIIGKRMKIVEKIGELKREKNVAILQTHRWQEILERMLLIGKQEKLTKDFIISLFKAMHQESIYHQGKVIND
ncbi:MAG: bifunctional 3-deoxy-7-phosphoheptulonate synthase/chorismate mutase type II [Flavobacteriaceae bacterium]